jgi:mRNA-degrading endonuclease RelE of RelBE toxin-antitoxin system
LVFEIRFSEDAFEHLDAMNAHQQRLILAGIQLHLSRDADQETRRRKKLRPNVFAPWELRPENVRVFYDVEREPAPLVSIRAVGVKHHNTLSIGGEELDL